MLEEVKVQDNVTASPLNAWSSAGVFTEMEDTGDRAAGEKMRKKSNDKEENVMTAWFSLDFCAPTIHPM